MAQVLITNLEGGLAVRNALNGMFTELYAEITGPIRVPGIAANAQIQIIGDTWLFMMLIQVVSGTPTLSVGSTGGGTDYYPSTAPGGVGAFDQVELKGYFAGTSNMFVTITGGSVNITILPVYNVF